MFKRCPCCDFVWSDADSFLADEELFLIGVQDDPEPSQLLVGLQHTCGTTLYVALANLVLQGVDVELLGEAKWPAPDGLPQAAQRLVGEALFATWCAVRPQEIQDTA